MKAENKTKKQLIEELARMQQRVIALEERMKEFRKSEVALRRDEQRFRSLVEKTSDWIWEVDVNGIYIYVSPKVRDFLGYEPEEVIGKSPFDFMSPDEAQRLGKLFGHFVMSREPFDKLENINLHKNGQTVVLETSGVPVFDAEDNFLGYRGIDRNITDLKGAELALQESEKRYRSIFDNAKEGIFQSSPEGRFISVNPALAKMCGFDSPEEMIESIQDIAKQHYVRPEDRERFKKLLYEHGQVDNHEHQLYRKDGSIIWASVNARIVRDDQENILYYEGTNQDISWRKQAEDKLRESQRRLSDIIEFLPDATFVIDNDGKVIAWNRAIEEMSGVRATDMLGKGDYEYSLPFYGIRRQLLIDLVFISDEEVKKKYHFVKKEGDIILAEADVPVKGRTRALWGIARPLYDSKGNIVGAIESIRDITDLRQTEKEHEKLILELQEALSKIKLLSGMLPICASCKKIRDDKGYWTQIESYIKNHSEADFSHSICPDCAKILYPEYYKRMYPENNK